MNLGGKRILSERRGTQETTYCTILFMWNVQKSDRKRIISCLEVGVGARKGGRDEWAGLQIIRMRALGVMDIFTIFVVMIS